MRCEKLAVLALAALVMAQAPAATAASSQLQVFEVLAASWGSVASPAEVGPGDIQQLVIALRTLKTLQTPTITAYIDLPRCLTSPTGESRATTYYRHGGTSVPAGSVVELQFRVRVSDDCSLGVHTARLTLEYITEVLYYSRVNSEELYVTVPITGRPVVKALLDNAEVYPGIRVMTLTLVNEGSAVASNLTVELSTSPAVYTNISRVGLGRLGPGESTLIPVSVYINPTLSDSLVAVTTTIAYRGPLGNSYSDAFRSLIRVKQYSRPLVEVALGDNELASGSSLNTHLLVSNIGSTKVKDVVVKLSAQQPLRLDGNSIYPVGSIGPGGSVSLPVRLSSVPVSVTTLASLVVTVEYVDEYGGSGGRTVSLPVVVRALRDTTLTVELATKEVVGGNESILRFRLSNTGGTDASNVTLQLILPQGMVALTPTHARLSSIGANATAYVDFSVVPPHTDSVQYSRVSLHVSYYDPYGNYFSSVYDHTVAVTPRGMISPLSVELQPTVLRALTSGNLVVRIASSEDVGNVRVSVSTASTPLVVDGDERVIWSLRAGAQYALELPYVVLNRPGTYTVAISVRYVDRHGNPRTSTYSYSVSVSPVRLAVRADISPKSLPSGDGGALRIRVTNVGDVGVTDLAVSVNIQGTAITLLNESGRYYVGPLEPGESRELEVLARSGYVSSYTVVPTTITLTYYDVLGQLYSESYTVNIGVEPRASTSSLRVEANTSELPIGRISNVTVLVKNVGYGSLVGLAYRLTSTPPLSVIGSNDGFIGTLGPGEYLELTVPLFVALTGQHTSSLTMTFSYLDKALGVMRSEDKVLTFILRGVADLRVADYVVIPTTVAPGQTFTISLTLINVGVVPAYTAFVTPVISGLPLRPVTEERSVYLGNIDAGSTSIATITLQLANLSAPPTGVIEVPRARANASQMGNLTVGGLPTAIRLPIVVTFLDNMRIQHNVTTEVTIRVGAPTVTPTAPAQHPAARQPVLPAYVPYVVLAVLAAVGAFAAWRYLRGRP